MSVTVRPIRFDGNVQECSILVRSALVNDILFWGELLRKLNGREEGITHTDSGSIVNNCTVKRLAERASATVALSDWRHTTRSGCMCVVNLPKLFCFTSRLLVLCSYFLLTVIMSLLFRFDVKIAQVK